MSYNILLVDDSKTTRTIQRKILSLIPIPLGDIFEAANGVEALEVLSEHLVDLVLTDLNMPEMGGAELVERMNNDETFSTIPVVVVSSEGSKERIKEMMVRGVRSFLRKPFTAEDLSAVLDEILVGDDDDGV